MSYAESAHAYAVIDLHKAIRENTEEQTAEEVREVLDIRYCPDCRQDCMPVNDVCLWCDHNFARETALSTREKQKRPRPQKKKARANKTYANGGKRRYATSKLVPRGTAPCPQCGRVMDERSERCMPCYGYERRAS